MTKKEKIKLLEDMRDKLAPTMKELLQTDGSKSVYYCNILDRLGYNYNIHYDILNELGLVKEFKTRCPHFKDWDGAWITSEHTISKGYTEYYEWKKDMINCCINKLQAK